MTDAEKRRFVMELYPGRNWRRRVNQMSDRQIFAIWKKEQLKEERIRQLEEKLNGKDKDDQDDIPF